jgi:hypothetical protein
VNEDMFLITFVVVKSETKEGRIQNNISHLEKCYLEMRNVIYDFLKNIFRCLARRENNNLYIYIYMCVCVCVCVYLFNHIKL